MLLVGEKYPPPGGWRWSDGTLKATARDKSTNLDSQKLQSLTCTTWTFPQRGPAAVYPRSTFAVFFSRNGRIWEFRRERAKQMVRCSAARNAGACAAAGTDDDDDGDDDALGCDRSARLTG